MIYVYILRKDDRIINEYLHTENVNNFV